MKALQAALSGQKAFQNLQSDLIRPGALVRVHNLSDALKPHLISALGSSFSYRLVIADSEAGMQKQADELAFYGDTVCVYPAKDLIFYQADLRAGELVRERMRCLKQILDGRGVIVITTYAALMAPMVPARVLREHMLTIEKQDRLDFPVLAKKLADMGYERSALAEMPGQFAIRGDIIDIFDMTADDPIRVECWGDEVESIRRYDPQSQRSTAQLESVRIFPASELLMDDDVLAEGMKKLERESAGRVQELRAAFLTEEAHRLEQQTQSLKEQLFELHMQVSLDAYIRYFYEQPSSLLDLFPPDDTVVFIDEAARVTGHAGAVREEFALSMLHRVEKGMALPGQADLLFSPGALQKRFAAFRRVLLEGIETQAYRELFPDEAPALRSHSIRAHSIASYNNSFDTLVSDLKRYRREGYRVLILSGSRARAKRLVEDLFDKDVTAFYSEDPNRRLEPREIMTYYGMIGQGFQYPDAKLAVISESDIFTVKRKKKRTGKQYAGERISDFSDLKNGDYVVHEDHGLGIYRGVEKIETDRVVKDYVKIEYAEGAFLYVLATGLSVIQKYASGGAVKEGEEEKKPKLNRLGGTEWTRTREKVQGAVDTIAQDLVDLYAARMARKGFSFGEDTVWQQEFEDAFPYEETEDQMHAIADVKRDMQSTRIMDRLICGDVGFGKTEVAIRAAFKAVQESKQVAVLVPTTILAQQHFNTFSERFRNFPVRVDLLSRFRTPSEQKRTVGDLKKGLVDIVIGTHRLLSGDVAYKDLGLLIVDEEQRFGVSHKEKIKKLKETVDVLTLSATPIPRTLHMSLIGIRDMSLLSEAPSERMPIQTFVCEHNDEMVREAIVRELSRRGQVYYVYNRINTIADITARVQALVPEARIAYAHGRMPEAELEKIMYDFIAGSIDVLVSTTIIETGLDIPNVNTMIIHDSEQMGLAQLYQLRGRVGRSNKTAYAFLMYRRDKVLREVAEKRLNAIREFTDLGSGYRIAMRDLEIRGAGNLLGSRQSGHMAAVGYEMYCRMLEDAIRVRKDTGSGVRERFTTTVDLAVDAYIPGDYIGNEEQKLVFYKRIAAMETPAEADDLRDELIDRFGTLPEAVENLIRISLIRLQANALFITDVKQGADALVLYMKPDADIDPSGIPDLIAGYRGALRFKGGEKPRFQVAGFGTGDVRKEDSKVLGAAEQILSDMQNAF